MTVDPSSSRPPWQRIARVVMIVASLVLAAYLVVGGGSYLGRLVANAFSPPVASEAPVDVEPGQPVTVDIPVGASGQDIGVILASNGVVRNALEFEMEVRNVDAAQSLRAGSYDFITLMDPAEVVAMLVVGPLPSVHRITIVEGLRVEEVLVRLAERTLHGFGAFEEALLEGEVTTSLREMPDEPELSDWEGLLFPDTYEFTRNASAGAILQRMATTMEQRVNSIEWDNWEELGFSVYEGIIAASIVESEIRHDDERELAASVIVNRLTADPPWRLQMDATTLYALDSRDPADLPGNLETPSPYNTYTVEGLPPTPISAPGRAALAAVADPADSDYFFYVVTDADGRHAFAETVEEHNANVARSRSEGVIP